MIIELLKYVQTGRGVIFISSTIIIIALIMMWVERLNNRLKKLEEKCQ